ncbi:MAG: hypothetical protein ACXVPV_16885 [Bacteroidia bacterium]
MKFKDADDALRVFKEATTIHGECTENGNYKLGNKNYDKIVKAVEYLKREDKRDHLYQFLEDKNIWVRLWSAVYLLSLYENEALKVLNEAAATKGIAGGSARTTVDEWKKGNLKNL